ncbi:MAG: 2-hydroxyglutaryl-CoA dehydratase [Deltaproteobacteria bacterium RBG_19FT_COMBO_46_12]|nr:MAG: 2-hydroxyglutaryl-CoA dehydratase [Deltaproteobacteria bacterium RBG_19FT_COMBO_46_12]
MKNYLGIDVGSITTKLVVLSGDDQVLAKCYIRNSGRPIEAIQQGLKDILIQLGKTVPIDGVATTGSARHLAAYLVGADLIKNEITAHAVAVIDFLPEAKTIIEIGGQDSKVIVMRNGVVADFAMNTVCAAGTGSFLDQQAARLGISIEAFGDLALKANHPVRIAGRCTVFAETDMIHKQQIGHSVEDIVAGLCDSLVKNYLNNVCRGKEILSPIVFQGGVAANRGIQKALERELGVPLIIPEHFDVMGAIGAAKLVKKGKLSQTQFRGFDLPQKSCSTRGFECGECENQCEVIELLVDHQVVACWGDLCERYRQTKNGLAPACQSTWSAGRHGA